MKLIIFLTFLLIACTQIERKENNNFKMFASKPHLKVGILVVQGVYNSEMMAPYDIFHHTIFHVDTPMMVFTVAPKLEPIITFEGLEFKPDFDFSNCPVLDILVVPSAEHSMDSDLKNSDLINFVKKSAIKAKYIMSLCDGAFILAQAGLLEGKKSTTFPSDISKFREMFPNLDVLDSVSFVVDGKLITSNGGAKSYEPALYLVNYLYTKEAQIKIAEGMALSAADLDFIFFKK